MVQAATVPRWQVRSLAWFLGLLSLWFVDGSLSMAEVRPSPGWATVLGRGALCAGYFALLSGVLAVPIGICHEAAVEGWASVARSLGVARSGVPRALGVSAAAGLLVAAYKAAWLSAIHWHNHELGSLLLVLLLSLAITAVVAGLPWLVSALAFLERRPAVSLASCLALYGLAACAFGFLVWDNLDGLGQLPPGLWSGGVAAVLVAMCSQWILFRRPLARPRAWAVVAATASVLAGSLALMVFSQFAVQAAGDSGWADLALTQLRVASDVDRDGASAWFGGGDCAPLDPRVHPLAVEVVGDGIDNNCLGGDRKVALVDPPPPWTGPLAQASKFNLLWLTIDTVRPDHLPMFGYARNTTPNLAEFAKEAVVFERTYTPAPLTRLAVPSMFASRRASNLEWRGGGRSDPRLKSGQPWFPLDLRRAGFRTAAFLPDFPIFARPGKGFYRGFQTYEADGPVRSRGGTMQGFPGKQQVDDALDWLKHHEQQRFFLWVHLVEPHFLYEREEGAPDWGERPEDLYDSELWSADLQAGRLFAGLRELGLWSETIVLVSGDHGESFREHGRRFHGYDLYESGIVTVGMMRVPGVAKRRVKDPVNLIDFAPTLLNLLDVHGDQARMRGQNLAPVLLGKAAPRQRVVVELLRLPLRKYELAVIQGRYKLYYISETRRFLFFDLAEDPKEHKPLAPNHPAYEQLMQHLVGVLEAARSGSRQAAAPPPIANEARAEPWKPSELGKPNFLRGRRQLKAHGAPDSGTLPAGREPRDVPETGREPRDVPELGGRRVR